MKLDRTVQSVIAKRKHLGMTKQRPWTKREVSILRKFYGKEPLKKTAKRLRKNPNTVANKARALKIPNLYRKTRRKK